MGSASTILIDFHGVLTNGKINISADGQTQYETVHTKDIAAIRELIANGFAVYIITSSDSKIIDAYCNKVGCVKIHSRIKSADILVNYQPYIAIGDSAFDLNLLLCAYLAFAPADADPVLLLNSKITTLKCKGGDGCIAEILPCIL